MSIALQSEKTEHELLFLLYARNIDSRFQRYYVYRWISFIGRVLPVDLIFWGWPHSVYWRSLPRRFFLVRRGQRERLPVYFSQSSRLLWTCLCLWLTLSLCWTLSRWLLVFCGGFIFHSWGFGFRSRIRSCYFFHQLFVFSWVSPPHFQGDPSLSAAPRLYFSDYRPPQFWI